MVNRTTRILIALANGGRFRCRGVEPHAVRQVHGGNLVDVADHDVVVIARAHRKQVGVLCWSSLAECGQQNTALEDEPRPVV
jgi:hypothetical protein